MDYDYPYTEQLHTPAPRDTLQDTALEDTAQEDVAQQDKVETSGRTDIETNSNDEDINNTEEKDESEDEDFSVDDSENYSSFDVIKNDFVFIKVHEDKRTRTKGFAFCNICQTKVQ